MPALSYWTASIGRLASHEKRSLSWQRRLGGECQRGYQGSHRARGGLGMHAVRPLAMRPLDVILEAASIRGHARSMHSRFQEGSSLKVLWRPCAHSWLLIFKGAVTHLREPFCIAQKLLSGFEKPHPGRHHPRCTAWQERCFQDEFHTWQFVVEVCGSMSAFMFQRSCTCVVEFVGSTNT